MKIELAIAAKIGDMTPMQVFMGARRVGKVTAFKLTVSKEENRLEAALLKAKTKQLQLLQKKLEESTDTQVPGLIRYRYVEIHNHAEALMHGKHTGWCTGQTDSDHYRDFYSKGRLWVLYKPKKRRPSYQLFISRDGVEFRKKGNIAVDPWEFAKENPFIKNWMRRVLPKRSHFSSSFDREAQTFFGEITELPHRLLEGIERASSRFQIAFQNQCQWMAEQSARRELDHSWQGALTSAYKTYKSNWEDGIIRGRRMGGSDLLYGLNYLREPEARETICIGGPLNRQTRASHYEVFVHEEPNPEYSPRPLSRVSDAFPPDRRPDCRATRHQYRLMRVRMNSFMPDFEFFKHASISDSDIDEVLEVIQ
jgi:hypothetical protein